MVHRILVVVVLSMSVGFVPNVEAITYSLDDGTAETATTLSPSGEFAWINQFTVSAGNDFITNVLVVFGVTGSTLPTGVAAGDPFKVYVWSDPNNDGNPADAVLLASAAATANAASIHTNVFQSVPINVLVPTMSFFIGASVNQGPSEFPAPLDTTDPDNHRSWVAASTTTNGFDPTNLPANTLFGSKDTFGTPGDYLLRAEATVSAVPEPATLALVLTGVAGVAWWSRKRR